jgi:hypothetical protein
VRRGKLCDPNWVNNFIKKILEEEESSFGSKKSILIAARANSLNLDNLRKLSQSLEAQSAELTDTER